MPLADLLNVPKTPEQWEIFAWNNRTQNTAIRQAIQSQKNINLTEYQLHPINFDHFQDFLEANSQSHDDFNSVLGLQSSDIEELDPKNANKLQEWIWQNYSELRDASSKLNI